MSHESFVQVTFTEAARPNSSLLCNIRSTGICHHENTEQTNWFCPFHSCWQDSVFVMVGEDLMEQRGWGERGYLGDRGEARWKGGIEGGSTEVSKGCAYHFLSSTSHWSPLPLHKHLRSISAWRCPASLHCCLPATVEPAWEVTKKEESALDPGTPSPAYPSSGH